MTEAVHVSKGLGWSYYQQRVGMVGIHSTLDFAWGYMAYVGLSGSWSSLAMGFMWLGLGLPGLSRVPHVLAEPCGFAEVFPGTLVVFHPQEEEEAQAELGRDGQKDRAGPVTEEDEKQPPMSQEKPAREASATEEDRQEKGGGKGGSKVRPSWVLAGRGGRFVVKEHHASNGAGPLVFPRTVSRFIHGLVRILVSPWSLRWLLSICIGSQTADTSVA